ncbi:DUF2177 family protein [Legionella erythra]|uniref:Membrane protein n=1 Tax=Legionella erythra TaxID=448 RepID=A0A0W0TKM2_LEGER|nr:DUF2177 family protein [Legionella erythra]KTC96158.1 membrane protein [Legionella erythra]
MPQLKLFFTALITFILLDMVWLGLIAKPLYFHHYREWLRLSDGQLQPVWWAAIIVYLLLAAGIVFFVVPLSADQLLHAAGFGALLGLITYGVYDLTCIAILKNWPVSISLMDWLWGIFLCAASALVTVFVHAK